MCFVRKAAGRTEDWQTTKTLTGSKAFIAKTKSRESWLTRTLQALEVPVRFDGREYDNGP